MTRREIVKRLLSLASDIVTEPELRGETILRRMNAITNAIVASKEGDGGVRASGEKDGNGEAVKRIFETWQKRSGHVRAKLSPGRRKKIAARLREGYSEADVLRAIDGALASAYHVENGYDDIELICRSAEKLEQFMNKAGSAPTGVLAETKLEALSRAAREALKEGRRDEYEQIQSEIAKRRGSTVAGGS